MDKLIKSLTLENDFNTIDDSKAIQNERLSLIGTMTAGIVHDLNTPLSAVQTFIYELKALANEYNDSIDNPNVTKEDFHSISKDMLETLNSTENSVEKILRIVNSVRNFTRNIDGDSASEFHLKEIINDIKTMIDYKLRHQNINFSYKENEDIKMFGDSGKLSQVLTNFIVNSIQAYDKNGGDVEVSATNNKDSILINIKDYGKGMSKELKNRLFKEMVTTKGEAGTGLGMYISNTIIKDSFKGKVWLESEENKGTTIFIEIPLQ